VWQRILRVEPDHLALKKLGVKVGLIGAYAAQTAPVLIARHNRESKAFAASTHAVPEEQTTADFEVRGFAAPSGVNEDPVTGSLNASLAQWLMAEGHAPEHYVAAQGSCLGRAGQVHLSRESAGGTAQVWVGGESVTCISGTVTL
jgi:PhzF family phenazine biosynthesis protein